MLETQLAQLAWNDRTRRAPVHTELLRELTEIGIAQDLAEHIVGQLDRAHAISLRAGASRIAGLSQYLLVTGDRWLENGGRVAFVGATGVGKTTMLAKLAVRWVLRHGPRDLALVACDSVRIGAQDQVQALGQLLGVPVYAPERFEELPDAARAPRALPPGADRHPGLEPARRAARRTSRCRSPTAHSKLETALVLAASTQAGAARGDGAALPRPPTRPRCLLTKLDEAASLGGALSVLIRARLPLSYISDGQRVPEDLRPARALELVSHGRAARAERPARPPTKICCGDDLERLSHATT